MPIKNISIRSPGAKGLNTQLELVEDMFQYGSVYTNLAFDEGNRTTVRKGREFLTTTAPGSNAIEQLFYYKKDKDTAFHISAMDVGGTDRIYSSPHTDGFDAMTNRTGSLTFTASNWKFINFDGEVVGFQSGHKPIYWDGTAGSFALLQTKHSDWEDSTTRPGGYQIGDTVKALSAAHQDYYMYCSVAGVTHATTEPTWAPTDGGTIVDNGVTWTYVKIPNGNCATASFGRIWATDESELLIKFCDISDNTHWFGFNAGSIDLTETRGFLNGVDFVRALSSFENYLCVFGEETILVYTNAYSPESTDFQIIDSVTGVGCYARDSVVDVTTDLLFLDHSGVKGLKRNVLSPIGRVDVSSPSVLVLDDIIAETVAATPELIRAAYHHSKGIYLLYIPSNIWAFDLRTMDSTGEIRISKWEMDNVTCLTWDYTNDSLIFGEVGKVSLYTGYQDHGSAYPYSFESLWVNMGATVLKVLKSGSMIVEEGSGQTISFKWFFDFEESGNSTTLATIPVVPSSEYALAEYGEDEYGPGSSGVTQLRFNLSGSGEYVKIGWSGEANGWPVIFQKINLNILIGRENL